MNSITLNGTTVSLNQELIETQQLDIIAISNLLILHARKMKCYEIIKLAEGNKKGNKMIKIMANSIREIEYELQQAWGFPKSTKYHKFWETPTCTCPKMDNEDRYPSGNYVVMTSCPVHGDIR